MGARRLSVEEAALVNDPDPAVRKSAVATLGGQSAGGDEPESSEAEAEPPCADPLDTDGGEEGAAPPSPPRGGDVISVVVRLRPLSNREAAFGGAT